MTKPETYKLVRVMLATTGQAARHDKQALEAMVVAYHALLADLEYVRCNAAVRALLAVDSRWVPPVSEIRRVVLELERGPVRPGGEAWGDVLKAIGRYGGHRAPGVDFEFDDPEVARCVKALGWSNICNSDMDGQRADRARFIELYGAKAAQERRELQSPLLKDARERRERGEAFSAGDLVAGLLQYAKEQHEQHAEDADDRPD